MALNFIRKTRYFTKSNEADETGVENFEASGSYRLLNPNGTFNIERKGNLATSLYERMVTVSWQKFLIGIIVFYVTVNSLFAIGYLIIGIEYIDGARAGTAIEDFAQCLYFSIQTFTTVGYGTLSPLGTAANILSSVVAFVGLISFSLSTGLFFSRFSRPREHIMFSSHVLIAPDKLGRKSLQFRIANASNNQMIDLNARVTLAWLVKEDGVMRRKFARLELELDHIHLFPLNWTIVHIIDEESPLYGSSFKELQANQMEILILIKGFDNTYNQTIHSKQSYSCDDLLVGYRFQPMYQNDKDKTILYLQDINDVEPYEFEMDGDKMEEE